MAKREDFFSIENIYIIYWDMVGVSILLYTYGLFSSVQIQSNVL